MNGLVPEHFKSALVHISAYLHGVVDRALYRAAGHTEEEIGICTESLLIDEVAPASDSLTYEETDNRDIEHGEHLYLAYLTDYEPDQYRAYKTAVYGKSAVSGIDHSFQGLADGAFFVVIEIKQDVVEPCADDTSDNTADNGVNGSVGINAEPFHSRENIEYREDKSEGDDDAVPLDIKSEYRKSGRIDMELPAELGELDIVSVEHRSFCHMIRLPSATAYKRAGGEK